MRICGIIKIICIVVALQFAFVLNSYATEEQTLQCEEMQNSLRTLNGFELLKGSVICIQEKQDFDFNFLLSLGQIRSLTDMQVLSPLEESDTKVMADLYGLIYYKFGGPGKYGIYQNQDQFEKLVQKIQKWNPIFENSYTPGWKYKKIEGTAYVAALNETKNRRIKQLEEYRIMYADKEYFELTLQIDELSKKYSNRFKVGTEEYEKLGELTRKRNEALKRLFPNGRN